MNVRISKQEKIKIANADDVFAVMRAILFRQNKLHRQKEYFWVIGLTTANDIAYIELVVTGILNAALLDPVEVFSFAVAKKCKKLILVHNHPAGTLKPSREDKKLTKILQKGGSYLNIQILDHLIITEENYFSFKQARLL